MSKALAVRQVIEKNPTRATRSLVLSSPKCATAAS